MGIIIRPVPGSIDPASVEDETERLKRESEAQVRLDYPTATFRDGAVVDTPVATPAAPTGPRASRFITIGNPNAKNRLSEEQLTLPPEKKGFFDQLVGGYYDFRARGATLDAIGAARRAERGPSVGDLLDNKALGARVSASAGLASYKQERAAEIEPLISRAIEFRKKGEAIPFSRETQDFLDQNSGKTVWEAFKAAPAKIIIELGARSGVAMVPGLVAGAGLGALGSVAGPGGSAAGFAAGMGAGSARVEYVASIVEGLRARGVNVDNAKELAAAVRNKELMLAVEEEATRRAAVIGGIDALAGLVGAKQFTPTVRNALLRELSNVGIQMPVQAALGATGEAGAQLAVGQDLDPRAIAAEAAGEFITAPVEVAGAAMAGARSRGETQPPPAAAAPATPAPGPATPPAAGPAPAAPQAATPAAAPATAGIPKVGDALLFQPTSAPGAVVVVQKVSPESGSAIVARVDPETGDPVTNEDGEPESFVATFADLKLSGVPAPAAPRAAKAPPAATSVEPTSDIAAQVKDMWRSDTPRRGVYVSPPTVAKMKQEGSYASLIKTGVVAENFDGQGGTLVVKSKKDLDEAVAARDGGQTDMQAIIGALTGAGVAKPKTPKPAVVQRKDETGAVVQQTAVEPTAVPAAVAAVKDLPGTVEVTTPEAVIAEREKKVADETTPPAAPAPARPKPGDTFGATDFAILFATKTLNTPKEGNLTKTDVRASAQAVGAAAQMLRQAAKEAGDRGAPAEVVAAATDVAKSIERIGDKPEKDFVKGRGVSEPKLRAKLVQIQNAFRALAEWRDKPRVAKTEAPKAAAAKKASKRGESAALNKTGDAQAQAALAKPSIAEGVKEDQAKAREKILAPEVAAEEAARAEMPPKVREVVEKAEQIFKAEQDRRKIKGTPPEGTAERRKEVTDGPQEKAEGKTEAPPPVVLSPTGVQVAPPGQRTVRRKTKYVPPKKQTDEQVAAKVAEDTAPKPVETIELAPAAVAGDEEAFITELMGATPQELQQELRMDPSGRMAQVLQSLVRAMGDRNSWAAWYAAVTRGGVMSRVQRNQMLGLIREYAAAERTEVPAVREKLLGLLTNIDGKMLPQQAIAAVFEAANVTRAYTTMATAVQDAIETPGTDLAEINEATGGTAFDPALINRETGSMGTAAANEIGGTGRTKPVFEQPGFIENFLKRFALNFTGLRRVLDSLAAASQKDRFMSGIMARSMHAQMTNGVLPGTHEILDGIIANAAATGVPSTTMRFLHQLRAAMPDVPVEFVPHDQPMMDEYGRRGRDPAGRFIGAGMLQVSVALDSKGLPIWTMNRMQTLLHEMVHAATIYELNRFQDSRLIREITQLRGEIAAKAKEKFGADRVERVLEFYRSASGTAVAPEDLDDLSPYLYGLTNNFELLAEGFTSPQFQTFLQSLDQTPTKSWYRSVWNSLVRAASRLLGFKNPADNRLLNDLLLLGLRTMAAQKGRAQRVQATRDKAIADVQEILRLPDGQVAKFVTDYFRGELDSETRFAIDSNFVFRTRVQMPRGSTVHGRMESTDQIAHRAYTAGPDALGQRIRETREAASRGGFEAPPHLKNHEQIASISTPALANAAAGVRRLMTSRFVDGARDRGLGFLTTDFLVSRGARLFGVENDPTNPLVAWKRLRDTRRALANRLLELAEKTVNSKWMKMNPHRSEQVGTMLQQTTLWQIDPEQGRTQTKLLLNTSQKAWDAKVDELNAAWAKLDNDQKDLYRSVQKYFKQEYSQIRRAGIDLAIDLFGGQITDTQRTMLYSLRNADDIEKYVGTGKFIDLGDQNDKFSKVVRDLLRVSAIRGPYFPLMRKGNLVVEAAREGILNDESGRPRNFDTKAEAQAHADAIRARAPKNTARVVEESGKFQVKYKMRHVSFHESQKDAQDAQAQLRQQGFEVGPYTRKLESVETASLSEGLKELISKAESVVGASSQPAAEQQLVMQSLQSAFVQILAERAASASQQLKRQGVAGFKGKEAHEIFARRTKASSWHYANLKTALAQSKALSRLRTASRDPSQNRGSAGLDDQALVLSRGRTLSEITKRLRVEADELDSLDKVNMDFYLGQLGFLNFLASPSYALVNAMQNFNVAMPYLTGKYGLRGAKALLRGMKVITGPTFAKAMRGLVSKPGEVTVYDVYSAIADAVAEHPRYAQFTKPQGKNPSALQQLTDMGVINASFVQELAAVANNQNLTVSRGMEWLRLFPQGAELWNRISTALAVLEVTNGDVEAAADAVWKVHFGYDVENRPRYFRKVGGTRLPQAITMFKMYGVGMYQLTGSLIVDTISRRGQSKADRGRAATALAGIIASHVLSAGVLGGIMMEPLRLLMSVWHAMFGDDDEFYDLDTSVQRWAKEVTESDLGGRLVSRGLWNALGFDLSGRMGLDRVLMFDPPETFSKSELERQFLALLGPIPSMIVDKSVRAYELATVRGKPFEAVLEMFPVKMLQDARKGWKLVNEGVTTPGGDVLAGPENFNWFDAVGRAAGFQTTEEAKLSDQADTAFGYRGWRTARVRQLTAAFWRAYDSGDAAANAEAVADIEAFNKKNPGAPITADGLRQSRQTAQRNARERTGEGRNPDLNKLLDY